MLVYSNKQAQVGVLLFNKAFTEVLVEYSNYSDIFSAKNAIKLLENTKINKYAIKLKEKKQLLFNPIYSLEPVKLVTSKTYIKTNLANGFIWPSKCLAGALILFNRKPDGSFRLCINYWGLNNITIKNQYLLFLIGKLLDCLG